MQRILLSFSLVGFFFLLFVLLSSHTQPNADSKGLGPTDDGSLPQIVQSPDIPSYADFCGEALPMDEFDSKERLDRELISNSYRHSGTILYLKRANKYFPIMEKILAEQGVPDDLKYLSVAESGLANVKSPAGARGFWQFMKATGQEKGLIINSEVDERLHLEKSTRAACKHLKQLKAQHGTWQLAAAAYNMGGPNLRKNMARQNANDYFDLNINEETMRYLYRIVAIKEIMKNPRNYGFYIDDFHMYQPFPETYEVEVKTAVSSWAEFAEQYGISYRELKIFNPWLTDSKLTNSAKKTYYIKIPK